MSVVFKKGQTLSRGDLDLFLTNSSGNVANAAEITYAIYFSDNQVDVLIGDPARIPENPAVGEYYASLRIPATASYGTYRIKWAIRELVNSPIQNVVQEFGVVTDDSVSSYSMSAEMKSMVDKLRILLRDQNPDKFYHFRPPEAEAVVGQYNRVFGQVWEDYELMEYLERALDWWNMMPPETENYRTVEVLVNQKPAWRTPILQGAIVFAAMALQANWIVDEFDYSIGGISLNIDKSSKYEGLKSSAESQWQTATEMKARTTKIIRGLVQPKYGIGVRSAFGPNVGRGVLSPRNFI
ncbi:hypothetical protein EB001_13490 [bacterium]|nr:hypothetical protein [bacterium]